LSIVALGIWASYGVHKIDLSLGLWKTYVNPPGEDPKSRWKQFFLGALLFFPHLVYAWIFTKILKTEFVMPIVLVFAFIVSMVNILMYSTAVLMVSTAPLKEIVTSLPVNGCESSFGSWDSLRPLSQAGFGLLGLLFAIVILIVLASAWGSMRKNGKFVKEANEMLKNTTADPGPQTGKLVASKVEAMQTAVRRALFV